jgi:hypothetical protein
MARHAISVSMHRSFCWMVSSTFVLFTLWVAQTTAASATDTDDLLRYLEGSYRIIGKKVINDETFLGRVIIKKKGKKLEVWRLIDGARIHGTGWIDFATPDRIRILRMRFHTAEGSFSGAYIFCSDLDNYARITGYLYRDDKPLTRNPGLEALFPEAPMAGHD